MSDRGTSETEQVTLGLAENDESPWEWGIYIERCWDNDYWTPLVYGELSYEHAHETWLLNCGLVTRLPDQYRNARLVRRAVGPWEVRDHE